MKDFTDSLSLMLLFSSCSQLGFLCLAVGVCCKSVHHFERLHHRQTELGLQSVRSQQRRLHHQRGAPNHFSLSLSLVCLKVVCHVDSESVAHVLHQEMTDIICSIYDMMGKHTYPNIKDSAPREHVDSFFQVKH